MSLEFTSEIGEHLDDFLRLAGEASAPYDRFVFQDDETIRRAREILFDAQRSEIAPPHGRLALREGRPAGVLCCLAGADLKRARLAGALALSRSEIVRRSPATAARLRLAGQVMWRPGPEDHYLARIAVDPALRGRGLARQLMEAWLDEASRAGATRCLLEVAPEAEAARALYRRLGFEAVHHASVVDPESGARLDYDHLARPC